MGLLRAFILRSSALCLLFFFVCCVVFYFRVALALTLVFVSVFLLLQQLFQFLWMDLVFELVCLFVLGADLEEDEKTTCNRRIRNCRATVPFAVNIHALGLLGLVLCMNEKTKEKCVHCCRL